MTLGIWHAIGMVMSSVSVHSQSMFWKAHKHNQKLGENESTDIGKNESLRKEGNARINKVLAMRQGCSKNTEKVRILRSFDSL